MNTSIAPDQLSGLLSGRYEDPFQILGPHEVDVDGRKAVSIRALAPDADQAWLVRTDDGAAAPMRRVHPQGVYEAICSVEDKSKLASGYRIRTEDSRGASRESHDPYAFPSLLTEYDLYLLGEGTHWNAYDRLGAHERTIGGVRGVNFAVWAPNARGVSVVGGFNNWDGRKHPMRKHIPSGVWELFVPEVKAGDLYKYEVRLEDSYVLRGDPYAFWCEVPPGTAARVANLDGYEWSDADWISNRVKSNGLDAPISVYEVHLGSWMRPADDPQRWLTYRELAPLLVDYCQKLGFTHLELMPVAEHPFTGSWGYQVTGYFAATSRYGDPQDFMYFVDYCHQHGIGVIIDWVPAHFPRDEHGLRRFDGTALYEHDDPRRGEHPDWGTMIFNYGRNEVRNFLIANALFWLDKYHIDGLRVDAVASMLYLDYSREGGDWIPNQFGGRENLEAIDFLKKFNEEVHLQYPGVLTIAEESTAWTGVSRPTYTGGLGFSLKWNMGWMNDTLEYMHKDPIHRSYHQNDLTFSLIYAFTENFCLPLSHDEVVHGKGSLLDKMPGDLWQRFANLRALLAYMWTHPGKKLLFMGGEFGQWNEWNVNESLQWHLCQWEAHSGAQKMMSDLNAMYRAEPALHEVDFEPAGFEWIDCHNWQDSVLVYLRRAKNRDDFVVVACNFTPAPRMGYQVGVPQAGNYREIFNSDSEYYGGSNVGNGSGRTAEAPGWHDRPFALKLNLPPLSVIVLKPEG